MSTATENAAAITLKGNPMTLLGTMPAAGDKAPGFSLKDQAMADKTLADYAGKVKIISVVPSVDTPICDIETKRFNEEAASLGDSIVILTVSVDLPPAFKRWCGASGVDKVELLSDFKDHNFGVDYGVRIKEIGLLARCLFVVDKDDTVQYVQLVPEVADEPDYDAVLSAAKGLV